MKDIDYRRRNFWRTLSQNTSINELKDHLGKKKKRLEKNLFSISV